MTQQADEAPGHSLTVTRYGRRPSRFFVMYADHEERARVVEQAGGVAARVNPEHFYLYRDAETLAEAETFAITAAAKGEDVRICERRDIRDVTPADDELRGQLWAFEERVVQRLGHPGEKGHGPARREPTDGAAR